MNVAEVIDFAIRKEQEAQQTYLGYAAATLRPGFRQLLLTMSDMEKEHERRLTELRDRPETARSFREGSVGEVRLADYHVEMGYSPEMEYGDFLLLVIQKEEKAERLYERLQSAASDDDTRWLFAHLANEESKHKAWARERYDQDVLKDN
jgi:rubrerythrin